VVIRPPNAVVTIPPPVVTTAPPVPINPSAAIEVDPIDVEVDPIEVDINIDIGPIDVDAEVTAVMEPTRCCAGIMPLNRAAMNDNLDMVHKYACRNSETKEYVLKQVGDTGLYNVYSKECTKDGIVRPNRRNPGVRCDSCHSIWSAKSFRLKLYITGWADRIRGVLQCLLTPVLTDVHEDTMKRFLQITKEFLSDVGKQLREKVSSAYTFYKQAKV